MFTRLALLALLTPLLYVSFTVTPARAKGSSYIVAATLDGGTLATPVTVPVRLPQNLDDMFELEPPRGVDGASLPYKLTLHYDFTEDGQGKRDWLGSYDGNSTLYFPESMVVGSGVWAAGWYTAVDVLATALASAISDSSEPRALPSTGAGKSSIGSSDSEIVMLGLLGLVIFVAGLVWRPKT